MLVVSWNKLYKKTLFENNSFREGLIHEDEFMAHRIIGAADSISVISDCLYHYRIRKDSIMGAEKKQDLRHLDILGAYLDRLEYVQNMMFGDLLLFMLYTYFEGMKQLMISYSVDSLKKYKLMDFFRKQVIALYIRYFNDLDSYQKRDYLKFILNPVKYRDNVLLQMKNQE